MFRGGQPIAAPHLIVPVVHAPSHPTSGTDESLAKGQHLFARSLLTLHVILAHIDNIEGRNGVSPKDMLLQAYHRAILLASRSLSFLRLIQGTPISYQVHSSKLALRWHWNLLKIDVTLNLFRGNLRLS